MSAEAVLHETWQKLKVMMLHMVSANLCLLAVTCLLERLGMVAVCDLLM